jgi:Putative Ig domain
MATTDAFVSSIATTLSVSSLFSLPSGAAAPQYLVLTALDRNEYTAGATGATGTLQGNGETATFSDIGGDGRGTGIVFTYQTSTGRYYNDIYGYLDQLTYTSSSSPFDVTNLSLFGTSSLGLADYYGSNAWYMMQVDAAGYLGSATVVTEPGYTGTVPSQATPDSIAAAAQSFIGKAWNQDGCWVLASTIAAEAGTSLPLVSTAIGLPGQSNGEWIVAFNGPAGQSGNWQSMVKAGEMIVIGTPGGGGHITTCVSGSGSSAMLVDNITYVNQSGQVVNSANDGSSSDVIVAAPHPASQEWPGVQASSVVIYELDTPVVSVLVASDTVDTDGSQSLAALFSATDPAGKAITSWQVYDTNSGDRFSLNGSSSSDHSAASALTVGSLSGLDLLAGTGAGSDTLEVRAFNGSYWGDWQSLAVSVVATPQPPVLEKQTPDQSWVSGSTVALTLPASTFVDPQNETLTYRATLSNGQALPGWLHFNASTETFTGVAPAGAQNLSITVTATDTSGLSAADTFNAAIVAAPSVASQTSTQVWKAGSAVSFALPANTFTDPQGEALHYSATLANGSALPGWLTFNAATQTFSGTAPSTTQNLSIQVIATDTSGLSASETFLADVQASQPVRQPGITVTSQTADQAWTGSETVALVLPSNTFTDGMGLRMSFAAYELNGPDVRSWLHFNSAKDMLFGTVPAGASGTVSLAVVAQDALHMAAADVFNVTLTPAAGGVGSAVESTGGATPVDVQPTTVTALLAGMH